MNLDIGYDAAFDLNEFGQARITSEVELIKNVLLFVLFSRKGQYPSLPTIGMDIGSRLYEFYDEIDPDELRSELVQQCSALGIYFENQSIVIRKKKYRGQPSMMIQISGNESYPNGYLRDTISNVSNYTIGITYDDLKKLLYDVATG